MDSACGGISGLAFTFPLDAEALLYNGQRLAGEALAITTPRPEHWAEYARAQYGAWLANRNDWVKEPPRPRRRLFRGLCDTARQVTMALRGEPRGDFRPSPSRTEDLAELYAESESILGELYAVIESSAARVVA